MSNIEKILKTWKTVFTVNDLKKILDTSNSSSIRKFLSKTWKKQTFLNLYYWIWGFSDYDIFELACKINKNSYVSFETVLKKYWAIFQYYETIFLASDKSIEKKTKTHTFKTIKLKSSILFNPIWIENKKNYMIASLERAICDRIYISPNYYFDNLSDVNWDKLEEIAQIYNKRVIKEIKLLRKNYAK